MIKTYPFDDNTQLSAHFNVLEFRCKCGKAHDTLISDELVDKLEQLYTAFNCSKIIVTSGFRCSMHDRSVRGDGTGQHTKGKDFPTIIKGKGLNGYGKEEVLPNPPAPAVDDGIAVEVTVDGKKYSGKLNKT